MARRTQTYAIRLAVEGGGQVKAELVSVGQSGEQSLKRIESAGERASGGLKGLGRQAELLRTGIRTLGGALIGVTTVGGLGALIDRSISAADAIGKTADKIGVGVEALQELRFAAKASGVEQQTLDMALQRFTRRAAEAAQGTGEAKDALAQLGIALRDQSGNLRRSEDLLGDVADAFARIEDPAERVRLAFKLFDSEGVALVNLLRNGSGALEEMRERARDLGIVLDEHLVRDADGNLLVEATSADTKGQAGSDLVEMIRFIGNNGGGTSDGPNIVSIDDIYVLDASTRLGQCRVSTLLPNADTADADWTPLGAGSHFAEVDDDNGDTSYIASDTATDLDMFDVEDLAFTPQTVHAVQISWRARKDDAATREVRSRIRSDAAAANGATRTLTSSHLYYHDVFEEDPDVAGPWTGAAVAAMEIGVETVT
jgi:hypothetical protein